MMFESITGGMMRKLLFTMLFSLGAVATAGAGCSGSNSQHPGDAGDSAGTAGSGPAGHGGPGGSGGADPTGAGGQPLGDSYEPDPVGATWTYATTDTGADGGTVSGTKTATVEAIEPVPGRAGITATRIHTVVPGAEDQMTWQGESATAIVRYRDDIYLVGTGTSMLEQYSVYAPSKLRMDLTHLTTNQTYTESYTESVTNVMPGGNSTSSTSKPFAWKVINGAESITVPAGTFTAVHLQKSNGNSAAIDKDYWFVRGVGKVKETAASTGRVEVLSSYHIP
jgi:hypothetical protein